MSNENETNQSELDALKVRADLLKLKYHPSIGVDALREKVAAAMAGTAPPVDPVADKAPAPATVDTPAEPVPETEGQKRYRLKQESLRLIRLRVTCMNPAKKEWAGEIFTVGNAAIGSVKRYVPFNVDEGWHVEQMIYQVIKERMCQIFVTVPDGRGGKRREGKQIREFAIELMPDLTADELAELAARQAATKAID